MPEPIRIKKEIYRRYKRNLIVIPLGDCFYKIYEYCKIYQLVDGTWKHIETTDETCIGTGDLPTDTYGPSCTKHIETVFETI